MRASFFGESARNLFLKKDLKKRHPAAPLPYLRHPFPVSPQVGRPVLAILFLDNSRRGLSSLDSLPPSFFSPRASLWILFF